LSIGDAAHDEPAGDLLGFLAGAERGERNLGDVGSGRSTAEPVLYGWPLIAGSADSAEAFPVGSGCYELIRSMALSDCSGSISRSQLGLRPKQSPSPVNSWPNIVFGCAAVVLPVRMGLFS
jgi:hypothetical protein